MADTVVVVGENEKVFGYIPAEIHRSVSTSTGIKVDCVTETLFGIIPVYKKLEDLQRENGKDCNYSIVTFERSEYDKKNENHKRG